MDLRYFFHRPLWALAIVLLFAAFFQSCSTARSGQAIRKAHPELHAEARLSVAPETALLQSGYEVDTPVYVQATAEDKISAQPQSDNRKSVASNRSIRKNVARVLPKAAAQLPALAIKKLSRAWAPEDEGDGSEEGNCCVNKWCLSYFLLVGIIGLAIVLIASSANYTAFLGWLTLVLFLILVGITIAFLVYVLEDGDRRDNLLTPPKSRKGKKSQTIEIEE